MVSSENNAVTLLWGLERSAHDAYAYSISTHDNWVNNEAMRPKPLTEEMKNSLRIRLQEVSLSLAH